MNYKINEMNPLEAIRLTERISQKDFAAKLGYPNKGQYSHHMRNFTQDVIDKVHSVYDRDITMDIINHLKFNCRKLKKQLKAVKKNPTGGSPDDPNKSQNIYDILDKD